MKFNTIWNSDINTIVSVSDNSSEPIPSEMSNRRWRMWFSRNFTGYIADKGGVSPNRWIKIYIELSPEITTGFTIYEKSPLFYNSSNLSTNALNLYSEELESKIDDFAEEKGRIVDFLLTYIKWQEVRDINATGIPAIQALSQAEREARFPLFSAEMAENPSDTPNDVLTRFTSQTASKLAKAGRIEARRTKLKRLLALATTQADKEAVLNTTWDDV